MPPRPLVPLVLVAALALPSGAALASGPFHSGVVVEASTMTVLWEKHAELDRPTASTIKLLTALVVADSVDAGTISWSDRVTVSAAASRIGGSQVYLAEGEVFTVRELLEATLVRSANDAAYALAEATSGAVPDFVELMRRKAVALGIDPAGIHSPHGLPPTRRGERTDRLSALDLARLGTEVLARPVLAEMVETPLAWFRNGTFQLYNANHLLRRYPYATGLKTGYHRGAGFCLAASAEKDGMTLVAVVMGADRKSELFRWAERLLDEAFESYRLVVPVETGRRVVPETSPWRGGIPVEAGGDVRTVIRRDEDLRLTTTLVPVPRERPVWPGDRVGTIVVRDRDGIVGVAPARATEAMIVARRPSLLPRLAIFLVQTAIPVVLGS